MARGLYISPTEFVSFAEPRQRLTDHIATRDRTPDFSGLGMFLPNPDPILKRMGRDIQVYRELRSDAHTGGCIRRRKAAVKALEWTIERGRASARITRLVSDLFDRLDMDRIQSEIMEAPLYGWQPLEVLWAAVPGGSPLPADLVGKPPEWFLFDTDAELRFRSRQAPLLGEPLDPRKFLLARQEASYANPYGFADLSMCFWPVTFKRGGLRFWVKFAEKYGMPWAVGKQPRNAPQPETDRLLDQLEAMIEDAVAVIPDDASVELMQAGGTSGNADAYRELLMFCRSEVAIALLGQNQSTEADSTHASAMAGLGVTYELRDGDKRIVEGVFNQFIRWVVDIHEGEAAPAPKFEMWEEEEVSKAQAERDEILHKAGLQFTPAYWKRTYELQDGDIETAPVPPVAPQPPANPHAPADRPRETFYKKPEAGSGPDRPAEFAETRPDVGAAGSEVDPLAGIIEDALGHWRPVMSPWLAQLQVAADEAAAKGETAAEFIARLPALLGDLDPELLADELTRLAFTARMGAQAGIGEEGE